jgi:hypothetical protein
MDEIVKRVKSLSDVYYGMLARAKNRMDTEELFRITVLEFALGMLGETCTPTFAGALVRKEKKPTAILEFCERLTEFIQNDALKASSE